MWLLLLACAPTESPADDSALPTSGACVPGAPAAVDGLWFVDGSTALVDRAATIGFGRVMVEDVDGDGWDDLLATPAHDGAHPEPPGDFDKLLLRNQGDGTFVDETAASGLADAQVGLSVFADVDNDGDRDFFGGLIAGQTDLALGGFWINDGAGRFVHEDWRGTEPDQLGCGDQDCTASQISATFADLDADGWLDLYVGGWFWTDGVSDTRYEPPAPDRLFRNTGDGTFRDRTERLGDQSHPLSGTSDSFGRPAMGIGAADADNDGDIDLFVGNYGAGRPLGPYGVDDPTCEPPRYWDQDFLWRNDGDFTFVDIGEDAGVAATWRGPDGITEEPPLVIGEECDVSIQGTYPSPIGGNSFTPAWGDFDRDGDLDLVVGSIAHPDYLQADPTLLFVNQGDGTFTEEGYARGIQWREDEKHVAWVDVDADGDLDLSATGFRDDATNEWRVYRNDDGDFTLIDPAVLGFEDHHQESVVFLDADDDGDLDAYVAEDEGEATLLLNALGQHNHRLGVRLVGATPADATGARVTVTSALGTQILELTSGGGHYNPSSTRTLYFGLGGDCEASVQVRWADGTVQDLGVLAADRRVRVTEGGGVEVEREWSPGR